MATLVEKPTAVTSVGTAGAGTLTTTTGTGTGASGTTRKRKGDASDTEEHKKRHVPESTTSSASSSSTGAADTGDGSETTSGEAATGMNGQGEEKKTKPRTSRPPRPDAVVTGYHMFCADWRPKFKKTTENQVEIRQLLSSKWRTMTPKEKEKYKRQADFRNKQTGAKRPKTALAKLLAKGISLETIMSSDFLEESQQHTATIEYRRRPAPSSAAGSRPKKSTGKGSAGSGSKSSQAGRKSSAKTKARTKGKAKAKAKAKAKGKAKSRARSKKSTEDGKDVAAADPPSQEEEEEKKDPSKEDKQEDAEAVGVGAEKGDAELEISSAQSWSDLAASSTASADESHSTETLAKELPSTAVDNAIHTPVGLVSEPTESASISVSSKKAKPSRTKT